MAVKDIRSVEEDKVVAATHITRTTTGTHITRTMKGIRWQIKVTGYCLLACLSLASLEVMAYAYLRVFQGYDGEHLMNYEFDDYKNIRLTQNYRNTKGISHNAQGFRRDKDTPREKSEGAYRIFIMGGSAAYGLGSLSTYGQRKYSVIKNDETIDHYLERYLDGKVKHKRVEVINAAITSHQSHHHLIYLNQAILKFRPDMVIFIDGYNDYYPYQKDYDQFRDYAYQERAHQFMTEPTVGAWLGYTGWWLVRKSHFIHLAGKTLRPIWLKVNGIGGRRARINLEEALANLRANAKTNFIKMVERNSLILRHEGVIPVFTLQPEIAFSQSKLFTPMEKQILDEMNNYWEENLVEYKNKARPIVIELLQKATAQTGSVFFDLTDVFGGLNEDAYTDYCHLTPMGNRRVAEVLGERILPLVMQDRGGRLGRGV